MPCDIPPGLLDCLFLGKGMLVKLLFYVETGLFTISWKIIMLIISTLENGTQMLVCLFCSILFLVSISQMELQIGGEINNLDKMLTLRSSSSSECILYPQPQNQFY